MNKTHEESSEVAEASVYRRYAAAFDCKRAKLRDPRETKGHDYDATTESAGPCCDSDSSC